jgi:hypothetical protein
MLHSVQDWQDCSARPDSRGEIAHRGPQREAFHCEQHSVKRVPELRRGRKFWRKGHVAMRANDLEPTLAKTGLLSPAELGHEPVERLDVGLGRRHVKTLMKRTGKAARCVLDLLIVTGPMYALVPHVGGARARVQTH